MGRMICAKCNEGFTGHDSDIDIFDGRADGLMIAFLYFCPNCGHPRVFRFAGFDELITDNNVRKLLDKIEEV